MLRIKLADWLKRHPQIRQTAGRLAAAVPPSLRLGRRFWFWYSFFRESESWTPQQMREHQLERVKELMRELSAGSVLYRKRFSAIDIDRINSLDDYAQLVPTITREEFADSFDEILSSDWKQQKLMPSKTSGTTGKALQFYHTTADYAREWAAICHQWSRVGYQPGRSGRAEFRGLTTPGSIVDYFPERKMIRCSILHLKREHIQHYAEEIRKHGIDYYHGYPSALQLLAATVVAEGLQFPEPKAFLLASEEVYDWQLESIRKAFPNAKLFAHYGCAERTVLAGWCEHRREYHVLPQYALVEVDPKTSEIIGTNLYNRVNGFVRYRMTDTVLKSDLQPCPDCGRSYLPRLISLGGRSEDYLFSLEKGWIPPAILTYPLKLLKGVKEVQFVQKEREAVIMRYTCHAGSDAATIQAELDGVRTGLIRIFGHNTRFDFDRVDEFGRTKSGKFKWILSELHDARLIGEGS